MSYLTVFLVLAILTFIALVFRVLFDDKKIVVRMNGMSVFEEEIQRYTRSTRSY